MKNHDVGDGDKSVDPDGTMAAARARLAALRSANLPALIKSLREVQLRKTDGDAGMQVMMAMGFASMAVSIDIHDDMKSAVRASMRSVVDALAAKLKLYPDEVTARIRRALDEIRIERTVPAPDANAAERTMEPR